MKYSSQREEEEKNEEKSTKNSFFARNSFRRTLGAAKQQRREKPGFSSIRRSKSTSAKVRDDRMALMGPAQKSVPPMPAQEQLEKMFDDVLKHMDLPVDKIRILRSYDNEKKWKLINDQQMQVANKPITPPAKYLEKLAYFLDKKMLKKALKSKEILADETSTSVLRHIEISLRTNSVDWVFEFLEAPNHGLQKLVDYMRHLLADCASVPSTSNGLPTTSGNNSVHESPSHNSSSDVSANASSIFGSSFDATANLLKKGPLTISKGKISKSVGEAEDDIHICMMCLRAIMNNKNGFQQVFAHTEAIYCIVRSILHQNLRTKTLVIQMLSSICMVQGGQEIVSDAFDRFEKDFREPRRFWTLMQFVKSPPEFHVEFLSSAVQFFDYFVNNVDDLNFRVHLQYEMTLLGLDKYIEQMADCESDELQERMISYANSAIDVAQLLDDSNQKNELLDERENLKNRLSAANERVQEVEAKWITDKAALDRRLLDLVMERDRMEKDYVEQKGTWTKTMNEKDRQAREDRKRLEQRIAELEAIQKTMQAGLQVQQQQQEKSKSPLTPPPPAPGPHKERRSSSKEASPKPPGSNIPPPPPIAGLVAANGASVPIPPPPPPPMIGSGPPPPPPPPPPPGIGGGPPPPPPPPGGFAPPSNDCKTIKKIYQTKNKLPQLNWTAMKPNQAKNTVFEKLNDELIIEKLDFTKLEEMFKMTPAVLIEPKNDSTTIGQISPASTGSSTTSSARKNTLLDTKRLQNVAITRRKVAMDSKSIMAAVHQLDLKSLPPEKVDILSRILPTDEERKMYADKAGELDGLSDEDLFLANLCEIERLEHKLTIMRVMAEFDETAALLEPQLRHVTAASKCARDATEFHGVLEVILAFGNYMNSGKRGGAYGFKLASLDSLAILKSPTDRTLTLLHMIVESIEKCLPELRNFAQQLKFVDKATTVQWDSVAADVKELESGFKTAEKERALKGADCPPSLVEFLESHKEKMEQLQNAFRLAQKTFSECVEFYGENPQSTAPNVFFQKLSHFVGNYAKCRQENEARAAAERRQKEEAERRARAATAASQKPADQAELMLELAERVGRGPRRQREKIESTRMDHGDFEKLMNGLKHTGITTPNRRKVSKSPSPAPRNSVPPPVAPKTRVLSFRSYFACSPPPLRQKMPQYVFEMGMTCSGCANAARKVLGKLGEDKLKIDDINVETKMITVTTELTADVVLEALKKTGKEVKLVQ
ncbi:unnamed protein product [Caenorhabditis bovis]|uniref:Uncharacterized protein n=1 Tax=Caenorhabditis bovis TaxID=2654633 RepID=A0A8S1EU47_9PELO|nr:unnamed protein product [Caenorhabditis bovis]